MRDGIIQQAARLFEKGFVVLDLETTGLVRDPQVEIIEVAALDHEGQELINTLVKPERRIPYAASRVNGLYDKDVVNAPPFLEVYPKIAEVLAGKTVITYNVDFDKPVLNRVCRRAEQPVISAKWFCAMLAYSAYRNYLGFIKLTTACKYERIIVADAHRAMGDCKLTLALMQKMARAELT
jgi:DNA polymerase-3 subunit epsilon